MQRVIFPLVTLALAACAITNVSKEPAINTDSITGFWSGEFVGKLATGKELPS